MTNKVEIRPTCPLRNQWIHVDDWVEVRDTDVDVRDTDTAYGHMLFLEESNLKASWFAATVRDCRKE